MKRKKVAPATLAYVGSVPGTSKQTDEWYTPEPYVTAVRKVFGGSIDLDPCTCYGAQGNVLATHIYTAEDSCLDKDWSELQAKTVFMNPPYSRDCKQFVAKFVSEYLYGSFDEGIVLVNNSTETIMFQQMLQAASGVCFPNHRISFVDFMGVQTQGNTRGQAFLYFGKRPAKFKKVMAQFGSVLTFKPNLGRV